jgi:NADH-quinone oxidoreductase subunit A
MGQYLPLVVMLVLGVAFAGISLVMSRLASPKRPSAAKAAPYECGIVPKQDPPDRFPVRFFLVAMIFVVLDIEIIFLYPYVVSAGALGGYGLAVIVIFSATVFASFVYLIANGALDWGPLQQQGRRQRPEVSAQRTTSSTVRRVGQEGRGFAGPEVAA